MTNDDARMLGTEVIRSHFAELATGARESGKPKIAEYLDWLSSGSEVELATALGPTFDAVIDSFLRVPMPASAGYGTGFAQKLRMFDADVADAVEQIKEEHQ